MQSYFELESDMNSIDGYAPKVIQLNKDKILIGRVCLNSNVDVYISAKKDGKEIISRKHAEIIRNSDNSFTVKDSFGALNGVFINSKRISEHVLIDGDIVQFGGIAKVPVGTTLKVSDICIKYRFRLLDLPDCPGETKFLLLTKPLNSTTSGNQTRELQQVIPPQATGIAFVERAETTSQKRALRRNGHPSLQPSSSTPISARSELETLNSQLQEIASTIQGLPPLPPTGGTSQVSQLMTSTQLILAALHRVLGNHQDTSESNNLNVYTEEDKEGPHNSKRRKLVASTGVRTPLVRGTTKEELFVTPPLHPDAPPLTAAERAAAASRTGCVLDASALRSHLSCAICGQILLDAVVARCSHGFCRYCFESFLREETDGSLKRRGGGRSDCPVCRDENSQSGCLGGLGPRKGRLQSPYHRSEHIDAIVWLLLQASDPADTVAFSRREQEHRRGLQRLGIDPDAVFDSEICEGSVSNEVTRRNNGGGTRPARGVSPLNIVRSKEHPSPSPSPRRCDYCGGEAHEEGSDGFGRCPHDSRPNRDLLASSEDYLEDTFSDEE